MRPRPSALFPPKCVIPVVVIERVEDAVPLAEALLAGGLKVIELTLRTPAALPATEAIAKALPQAVVGLGTLVDPVQAGQARDAGAQFLVSPGLTPDLAAAAQAAALPYLPAVATPTEAMVARTLGFAELKLFPARQVGGVEMLKAIGSVLPDLSFCPTGGVAATTAPELLALPNVFAVGGSWLTPAGAVRDRRWGEITALAAAANGGAVA